MHLARFALILFFAMPLAAQDHPALAAQPNTVYVSADGKFESPPDTALVQFNIAAQEEQAKDAYDRAARAAEQVRQILRSNGIDPKSAELGFFSIQPVYDYRTPKRKLVGYRVNSSVSLKLTDFNKIGPMVQQLSDIDITENQTVNYTLQNIDSAKQKAVQDAYQRARASADTVALAGGRSIISLIYASVDTFEQVRLLAGSAGGMAPMRAMAAQAPAPTAEFSPQKIVVTAHVNALFGLNPGPGSAR